MTIIEQTDASEGLREALRTAKACIEDLGSGKGGWAWEEVMDQIDAALRTHSPSQVADNDCEDQALHPTKTCTMCRRDFDDAGKPIYAPLVKHGRFWCCEDCGSSYGERPHPDLASQVAGEPVTWQWRSSDGWVTLVPTSGDSKRARALFLSSTASALLEASTRMRDFLIADGDPPTLNLPEGVDPNEFTQAFDALAAAIRDNILSTPAPVTGPITTEQLDQLQFGRSLHERPVTGDVREALELAEDVLSRAPFSTGVWPNGIHPQGGIAKIRKALAALAQPQPSDGGK